MTKYIIILTSIVSLTYAFLPLDYGNCDYNPEHKYMLRSIPPSDEVRMDSSHSFDVRHYELNLNVPMTSCAYSGLERLKFVTREADFDTFNLHFVNLVCDSVKRGNTNLIFLVNSGRLKITLDRTFSIGETCIVEIYYHRNSSGNTYGIYYYPRGTNPAIIYTTTEPIDSRYWFPCFDENWDKAEQGCDIFVTVPDSFTVCANGLLDSVKTNSGLKTFYWSHKSPISTYLMTFTASIYATWSHWYRPTPSESIEVKYFIWRADSNRSISAFANVVDMMQFFSSESMYGPYPFEKYGMNAVSPFQWGGMENQTMTMIHRSWLNGDDDGIAHELSHMWWGDKVTCFSWANIWLNEGFATYSDALYMRHLNGQSYFTNLMNSRATSYFNEDATSRLPLYNPPINNLFTWGHTYCKASWLQHMLRYLEGDTTNTNGIFFQTMRVYGDSFRYKNASTEDYKRIHEQETGMDLDWFFDEWVYQAGYPKYYYNWRTEALPNLNQFRVITQISQNNGNLAPTVFHMPLQFRFTAYNFDTTITRLITTSPQIDTFILSATPTSMALDPNNWVLKKTFLGIEEESNSPLYTDCYSLKAYPNPVKSLCAIRYSLPVKSKVSLKLYDASGKLVKTLIDQNKSAGIHTLKIENSKLKISNGVYFLKLELPNQALTQKIIVVP